MAPLGHKGLGALDGQMDPLGRNLMFRTSRLNVVNCLPRSLPLTDSGKADGPHISEDYGILQRSLCCLCTVSAGCLNSLFTRGWFILRRIEKEGERRVWRGKRCSLDWWPGSPPAGLCEQLCRVKKKKKKKNSMQFKYPDPDVLWIHTQNVLCTVYFVFWNYFSPACFLSWKTSGVMFSKKYYIWHYKKTEPLRH